MIIIYGNKGLLYNTKTRGTPRFRQFLCAVHIFTAAINRTLIKYFPDKGRTSGTSILVQLCSLLYPLFPMYIFLLKVDRPYT